MDLKDALENNMCKKWGFHNIKVVRLDFNKWILMKEAGFVPSTYPPIHLDGLQNIQTFG